MSSNNRCLLFSQFCGLEVGDSSHWAKSKVSTGCVLFQRLNKGSGASVSLLFQLLEVACIPWLMILFASVKGKNGRSRLSRALLS